MRRWVVLLGQNPQAAEVYAILLGKRGYQTVEARDAEHAWALFGQVLPDAVVTRFPQRLKSGVAFCELLRRYPPFECIPIVDLTADAFPDHRAAALAAGVTIVLPMPVQPLALADVLDRVIAERRPVEPLAVPASLEVPLVRGGASIGPRGMVLPGHSRAGRAGAAPVGGRPG